MCLVPAVEFLWYRQANNKKKGKKSMRRLNKCIRRNVRRERRQRKKELTNGGKKNDYNETIPRKKKRCAENRGILWHPPIMFLINTYDNLHTTSLVVEHNFKTYRLLFIHNTKCPQCG